MHTQIIKKDDGFYHYNILAVGGVCFCKNKSKADAQRQMKLQRKRAKENMPPTKYSGQASRTTRPGLKQRVRTEVLEYLESNEATITECRVAVRASSTTVDKVVDGLMVEGLIKRERKYIRGRNRDVYLLV